MSPRITTTNIDQLIANPLPQGRWRIDFVSTNFDRYHQLYVNGTLADWTETTSQRYFILPVRTEPCEITIAAVDPVDRSIDLAHNLPQPITTGNWIVRHAVVPNQATSRFSHLELLAQSDDGSPPFVVARREAWPAWASPSAMGQDDFGVGGFGFGGSQGPGLGNGAFGLGPLGIDADPIELWGTLPKDGLYHLTIRCRSFDAACFDVSLPDVRAMLPPLLPLSVRPIAYDAANSRLSLQLQ